METIECKRRASRQVLGVNNCAHRGGHFALIPLNQHVFIAQKVWCRNCFMEVDSENAFGHGAGVMHSFAWWPTVLVLGVATFTDLRSRRIPNWLVFPFFGCGLVVSVRLHGWQGAEQSLYGAGLGLLIYGFLFWMGGMGAGDVKL